MYLPLFVGVLCLSLFCYALLCVHSIILFYNHLEEEEKADCFAIIVLQMYCYCKCQAALPHGAVGWFAVCDCGISRSYSLTFLSLQNFPACKELNHNLQIIVNHEKMIRNVLD